MMPTFVTIATFNTPEEAQLAAAALAAQDIEPVVNDSAVVGNLWTLGNAVGGVKLQVAEEDVERARQVLDAPRSRRHARGHAWDCVRCGQHVDAGFEVCWNCGATRDGIEDPDFSSPEAEPDSEEEDESLSGEVDDAAPGTWTPHTYSVNPYASPQHPGVAGVPEPEGTDDETAFGDAMVARAFRAAVLGMVFCPPALSIYSACILLRIAMANVPLSDRANRQYLWSWVLNIVGAALGGMLILTMIRDRMLFFDPF